MIGYRHLIAVGLIALCCCVSPPALAQAGAEREGTQLYATEEEARQREEAADLRDRVSRVEGRLEGIEEASVRAAAASEKAAGAAAGTIATVRWCTSIVSVLIVIVGGALGFFGYKELKAVQEVRDRADKAVKRAEDCAKKADDLLDDVRDNAEEIAQEAKTSTDQVAATVKEASEAVREAREMAQGIATLRDLAEAAAARAVKVDPSKELSAEEEEVLKDATRRAELLEDLGQELTADAYIGRGNYYFDQEDYERALAESDRAIGLQPDYSLAHHNRGASLVKLGQYQEALAALDRAVELAPNDAGEHYSRGTVLILLGRCKEAKADLNRAIELRPDYGSAHYNRACAHARLGHTGEALRDLRKAIELDAKFSEEARTDEDHDFDNIREDPEFRQLVGLDTEGGEGE
jgi:tetratricopeptide (TPR) repeat protein